MGTQTTQEIRVPKQVRCYLEPKGDQWQAFSLEFGLAVQGDSAGEVKEKLERVIRSYLRDAILGEDREHAEVLLRRRASSAHYVKYSIYKLVCAIFRRNSGGPQGDGYRRHPCTFYEEPKPLLAGA